MSDQLKVDNTEVQKPVAMRRVNMEEYKLDTERYEVRSGKSPGAPLCPYGHPYLWIGYDFKEEEYIRVTKSVFKILVEEAD